MSFWNDITGKTAADASKAAALDTYQKQNNAVRDLTDYGNVYADKFAGLAQGYDPYVQTGYTANNQLQRLLSDPTALSGLPGYQFAQGQGVQALDRSAAARGMLNSGRSSKDLLRFGTGLADQTYGNQLQRLLAASGQGAGWLGAQNATVGQGLQGQLQTRNSAFGGQMQSAGTIGQGDIAAANARAAGTQNLLNMGGKIAGSIAGMPGGFSGLGSSLGSMFSGSSYSPSYMGGADASGQLIYGPGF